MLKPVPVPDVQEEIEALDDWTSHLIVPHIITMTQQVASRERMLAVFMVQVLIIVEAVQMDVLIGFLLPVLINASRDAVPNVRILVAKTVLCLIDTYSVADSVEKKGIAEVLWSHTELIRAIERFGDDSDRDIRHFGRVATSTMQKKVPAEDSACSSSSSTSSPHPSGSTSR